MAFDPDAYLASKTPAEAPDTGAVPTDQTQVNAFDPNQYLQNKETAAEKARVAPYQGLGQTWLAGTEGTLRGATQGASDYLEQHPELITEGGLPVTPGGALIKALGFAAQALKNSGETTPEKIAGRAYAHPVLSGTAQILGGAPLAAAGAGAVAPIAEGLAGGAGIASKLMTSGVVGAGFGAGNVVSDAALGDPNLNAQKIASHVLMGSALGIGSELGLGILSKSIGALPAILRAAKPAATDALDASAEGALGTQPNSVSPEVTDTPTSSKAGVQGTSIDDLIARNEKAKLAGLSTDLPEKAALLDAASRVPMENPIHPLQVESLTDQGARDVYKIAKEFPGPEGDAIRNNEAIQKNELVGKTDDTIASLSPHSPPVSDATQGGQKAIEAFTDQYQTEKKALGEAFEQLKETSLGEVNHLPGVIEAMTDKVPGVAQMFDTAGEQIKIKPYSTRWGIDEATYRSVKQAVSALKEGPTSFEELQNIRNSMGQHIDLLAQGQGPGQIRGLKAAMMDYMQNAVQEANPTAAVRDTFRKYAINEQQRQVIEKVFGASVGTPEFGAISKIKPENILDRVFSNTANVKAAKSILEPEKFNELLSNWMAENRAKVTDQGSFSSNKFASFLKRNQDALNEAFASNPEKLQALKDHSTIMRILPDAASVNPSGTAKTLWSRLKEEPSLGGAIKSLIETAKEHLESKKILAEINEGLAMKADQASKLKKIGNIVSDVTDKISDATDAILGGKSVGLSAPLVGSSIAGYQDRADRVQELANHPQVLMEHLSDNTEALAHAAPNITQSLHNTISTAVQFLDSKIPKPSEQLMLSSKFDPSDSQKRDFNRYFDVVNSPLVALRQVANGTLNSKTLEALNAVHPDLYKEMQKTILEKMDPETAKKLPYSTKIGIAKFLQSPLDENMMPQMILNNQSSLNAPSLSQNAMPKEGRKAGHGDLKNISLNKRVQTQTQKEDDGT